MLPSTLFIPLGTMSTWQDNELRYALRSWQQYSTIERVLIIGHKPDWYTGDHIRFDHHYSKTEDIFRKTEYAATLYDRFIFANDDHVLLQPLNELPYYYDGYLKDFRSSGSDTFRRYVNNTLQLFPDGKYFDVHTPMVVESHLMPKYTRDTIFKSCYCNSASIQGVEMKDPIIRRHFRMEDIYCCIRHLPMFSYSDSGLSNDLKKWIAKKFPDPSRWEK